MFISPFLLVIVIVLLVYLIKTKWKYIVLWWKIGGPCVIPYTVPIEMTQFDKVLYAPRKWASSDGKDWYGFSWMGPIPVVYVADPELTQIIFTTQSCLEKSCFYDTLTQSYGYGLLTQNNPHWSRSRKLISPVFTHKVLLSFFPIFNKQTDILNEALNKYVNSEPIELFSIIAKCTFDIANETTMGTQLNVQTKEHCDQWEAFVSLMHICMERVARFWLMPTPIFKLSNLYKIYQGNKSTIHDWVQKVMTDKLTKVKEDKINSNNTEMSNNENYDIKKSKNIFIDHVYELVQRNEFTWNEFEIQSVHIILGAFETTATTTHNVLMVLAMYPDIQEKVFEEIHTLFPDKNFSVHHEETLHMPYLDMVINETLRLIPTVPLIARKTTEDVQIKKDVWVPKGTTFIVDIYNLHRNPLYWGENCDKFDPDNFSSENMRYKHQYAFIPFLKGLRNCIGFRYAGMSLKVILAKIIRNYRFTTDFKFENLRCIPAVSVKFTETPKIQIYRREK